MGLHEASRKVHVTKNVLWDMIDGLDFEVQKCDFGSFASSGGV